MHDPRLEKLADVLVRYSTDVRPGQTVRLAGDAVAMPLLRCLYAAVLRAGGHPLVRVTDTQMTDLLYELGNAEQLAHLSPTALPELEHIDASIGLWADVNTRALSRVDPARQSRVSAARRPYMEAFMSRAARGQLKWVGTQYPTHAAAQDAEMSLSQYADFVFDAGLLNDPDPVARWQEVSACQQRVVDHLQGKRHLHFQTPLGTDLHVDVSGMTWINCDGHENFPDGEVFTGPNLNAPDDGPSPGGVNGVVRFGFPAVYRGREVHDVELTLERGRVVDAKASKNLDFLVAMLDQDPAARSVGEIAIGTNYRIREHTRNILFDEKIGGTFHMAVGAGYPETGNTNTSGLHWDMICDLRGGGTITVDGEVISRDGRFVFDGWPAP